MAKKNQTLTSVKINTDLFKSFKSDTVNDIINFQKLCDRSLYLYLNDIEFKNQIKSTNQTEML